MQDMIFQYGLEQVFIQQKLIGFGKIQEYLFIASYYRLLSAGVKMINYKTGITLVIFVFYSWEIVYNTMLYMIYNYAWQPVIIQRTLIGFKAIE